MLLVIRRAARPHVAFLGRIPGTRRFSDLVHSPENEPVPGALLFRVEASLMYFNVDRVKEAVMERIAAAAPPPCFVVADLSSSPNCDVAGARMLAGLHKDLQARGIRFRVCEGRAGVRQILRAEGLEERVGKIEHTATLAEVVEEEIAALSSPGAAARAVPLTR
jgi:MFS superfamily sulfate permease-like transporter